MARAGGPLKGKDRGHSLEISESAFLQAAGNQAAIAALREAVELWSNLYAHDAVAGAGRRAAERRGRAQFQNPCAEVRAEAEKKICFRAPVAPHALRPSTGFQMSLKHSLPYPAAQPAARARMKAPVKAAGLIFFPSRRVTAVGACEVDPLGDRHSGRRRRGV